MNFNKYPLISSDKGRLFLASAFAVLWTFILIIGITQAKIAITETMFGEPVRHVPARGVSSGTPASAPIPTGWKTYRNEKYGFEFQYPANLVLKTDTQSIIGKPVLVQIAFPGNSFPETNFVEAGFSVAHLGKVTNCLQRIDDYPDVVGEPTNSGVLFNVNGAAAGNLYESNIYRQVHAGECFEIVVALHTGNIHNYPAGTVTEFKRTNLHPFYEMLETFHFISSEEKEPPAPAGCYYETVQCIQAPCPEEGRRLVCPPQ